MQPKLAASTEHYLEVLRRVREQQLHAEISVKPTQLGLDLDFELCYRNLREIIAAEMPTTDRVDRYGSQQLRGCHTGALSPRAFRIPQCGVVPAGISASH